MLKQALSIIVGLGATCTVFASSLSLPMTTTDTQRVIGTVTISESPYGVIITPALKSLTTGTHGFHLHLNPSCANNGKAAGGHFDPNKTNAHLGPYADGHLGDLPVLIVDANGQATLPILAPRLKLQDFYGHSLMIHAGSDNYSDIPNALGGGGARVACGVIQRQQRS